MSGRRTPLRALADPSHSYDSNISCIYQKFIVINAIQWWLVSESEVGKSHGNGAAMSNSTRRGFLAASGVGAAAVGVAAIAPSIAGGRRTDSDTSSTEDAAEVKGPLVAYVKDASTGEVAVMVGENEVLVTDKKLVAHIARVTKKAV